MLDKPAAVDSTYDVAYWFIDQALNDSEYLQPMKLHILMFFSQAYFAVMNRGQRLMPAIFVAHITGPVEPNTFRLFEGEQRPYLAARMLPEEVEEYLTSVWRRFGSHSAEHLVRVSKKHPPYVEAWDRAANSEITIQDMVAFYGKKRTESQARAYAAPNMDQVVRPRTMRTQDGRAVKVQAWKPGGD